mgnify:CR=1 FL=1
MASAPTWSPDGRSIVYLTRVSGNEKLFKMNADGSNPTQITFGTHDDAAAQFIDADTIAFASTATDPNQSIDADVARNGNIYNIWTLSLKNGELRQYTDALGGNTTTVGHSVKCRNCCTNQLVALFAFHMRDQAKSTVVFLKTWIIKSHCNSPFAYPSSRQIYQHCLR